MNRRGFFSLLAGASVAALAPALLARQYSVDPIVLRFNGMRYHPLMPNVLVREQDGRPYRITERDGWIHIEPIQIGPAFAAGSLGSSLVPADPITAQILSTLTPPLA